MSVLDRFQPARLGARALSEIKRLLGIRTVRLFQSSCNPSDFHLNLAPASRADIAGWQRSMAEFPWPDQEVVARRHEEGNLLWALRIEDQPVCFGWIGSVHEIRLEELGGRADLTTAFTWVWDCVTPLSRRGHGYFTQFLLGLRAQPLEHPLAIGVEPDNRPSLKSIERAGFQSWAEISVSPFGQRVTLFHPHFGPVAFCRITATD